MSTNTLIITAVGIFMALVYYIHRLAIKIDQQNTQIKEKDIQGEIKVNEYKVNESSKKATASLEHYRELLRKSNRARDNKKS